MGTRVDGKWGVVTSFPSPEAISFSHTQVEVHL